MPETSLPLISNHVSVAESDHISMPPPFNIEMISQFTMFFKVSFPVKSIDLIWEPIRGIAPTAVDQPFVMDCAPASPANHKNYWNGYKSEAQSQKLNQFGAFFTI